MAVFDYGKSPVSINEIEGNTLKLSLQPKDDLATGIKKIITFKGDASYHKCKGICVEFTNDFSGLILYKSSCGIEIYYKNCFIRSYYDDSGRFVEKYYIFSDNEEELNIYFENREGLHLTEKNKKIYQNILFVLENTNKKFEGIESENKNGNLKSIAKYSFFDKRTNKKVGHLEECSIEGIGKFKDKITLKIYGLKKIDITATESTYWDEEEEKIKYTPDMSAYKMMEKVFSIVDYEARMAQ